MVMLDIDFEMVVKFLLELDQLVFQVSKTYNSIQNPLNLLVYKVLVFF